MASFYGASRTNYVRLKDPEALKDKLQHSNLKIEQHPDYPDYYCLEADSDSGCFDVWFSDPDTDEQAELLIEEVVAPHLEHGQVLVLIESGAEKLCYITGAAIAYAWDGRVVVLRLDDIYALAASKLGVAEDTIALAEGMAIPLADLKKLGK